MAGNAELFTCSEQVWSGTKRGLGRRLLSGGLGRPLSERAESKRSHDQPDAQEHPVAEVVPAVMTITGSPFGVNEVNAVFEKPDPDWSVHAGRRASAVSDPGRIGSEEHCYFISGHLHPGAHLASALRAKPYVDRLALVLTRGARENEVNAEELAFAIVARCRT